MFYYFNKFIFIVLLVFGGAGSSLLLGLFTTYGE